MESKPPVLSSPVKRNELSKLEVLKLIGTGRFSRVYLVRDPQEKRLYALKTIKKDPAQLETQTECAKNEAKALRKMQHCPFVVRLHRCFQAQANFCFLLEYCPHGELISLFRGKQRLTESQSRVYMAQVVLALEALHAHKIVYRDLKPENIVIGADHFIRLVDFGLAKNMDKDPLRTVCGTKEYLAPEVLKGQAYGKAVDWWALGCLIFESLVGIPPFFSKS